MLYGASGGLLALGIVLITREETRWLGIFWLLAAAILAFAGWRKAQQSREASDVRRKPNPRDHRSGQ